MSRCVNKITLVGNVGSEPEVRTTTTGNKVAKVSLATSHSYKGKERTDWHRLTFFSRLAEVVEEFVRKGDRLYVEGRVEYNTTENADGEKRFWTDVVVNDLVMLSDTRPKVTASAADEDEPLDF